MSKSIEFTLASLLDDIFPIPFTFTTWMAPIILWFYVFKGIQIIGIFVSMSIVGLNIGLV